MAGIMSALVVCAGTAVGLIVMPATAQAATVDCYVAPFEHACTSGIVPADPKIHTISFSVRGGFPFVRADFQIE
jgi:hypothetical protein